MRKQSLIRAAGFGTDAKGRARTPRNRTSLTNTNCSRTPCSNWNVAAGYVQIAGVRETTQLFLAWLRCKQGQTTGRVTWVGLFFRH